MLVRVRPRFQTTRPVGTQRDRQQGAGAVADVLELTFFDGAGPGQSRGILPLEDLHPGLLVAGQDQAALFVKAWSIEVQLADALGLGVEVGVVTVEPVDAAMRLEVGLVQDPPDGRTLHRLVGMPVDQDGREIVKAPLAGDALMRAGFAGGQSDDFELFLEGKSPVADRNAEHLEGQRGRAGDSAFAKGRRCCDCNQPRWRPANWTADPWRPAAGSADSGRPKLAAWTLLEARLAKRRGLVVQSVIAVVLPGRALRCR